MTHFVSKVAIKLSLSLSEGYTKFENTGSNRNREICDRNFYLRERKMTK